MNEKEKYEELKGKFGKLVGKIRTQKATAEEKKQFGEYLAAQNAYFATFAIPREQAKLLGLGDVRKYITTKMTWGDKKQRSRFNSVVKQFARNLVERMIAEAEDGKMFVRATSADSVLKKEIRAKMREATKKEKAKLDAEIAALKARKKAL